MPTVLVQTGHVSPREPGFEDATGAAGEQAVVKVIAEELRKILAADSRFGVRVIPGKIPLDVRSGAYQVDAFLSLHCDGSTTKSRRGWGIGYPSGSVNKRLSDLVGVQIDKIHPSERIRDNYTSDMSGYYGYSRVPTPGPEILIEHGFASNAEERAWMVKNAKALARAEYLGLLAFWKLPENAGPAADGWITPAEAREFWNPNEPIWENLPGPKGKPPWLWQADIELQRRRAVLRDADPD